MLVDIFLTATLLLQNECSMVSRTSTGQQYLKYDWQASGANHWLGYIDHHWPNGLYPNDFASFFQLLRWWKKGEVLVMQIVKRQTWTHGCGMPLRSVGSSWRWAFAPRRSDGLTWASMAVPCSDCGVLDLTMDTRPGKHTKNHGKSPFLMGKSTIDCHFQ